MSFSFSSQMEDDVDLNEKKRFRFNDGNSELPIQRTTRPSRSFNPIKDMCCSMLHKQGASMKDYSWRKKGKPRRSGLEEVRGKEWYGVNETLGLPQTEKRLKTSHFGSLSQRKRSTTMLNTTNQDRDITTDYALRERFSVSLFLDIYKMRVQN
jgi:hypothetical protein